MVSAGWVDGFLVLSHQLLGDAGCLCLNAWRGLGDPQWIRWSDDSRARRLIDPRRRTFLRCSTLCSNDERPVGTNSAMKTNHDNHKRNTTSRRARRPLFSINVADALHDRSERNTIKHGAQMAMG